MKNTYKLDSRGIPYRVEPITRRESPERKQTRGSFSDLLIHSGRQKNFHLYVFQ